MGNVTVLKEGGDHGDVITIVNAQIINALGEFVSDAIPLMRRSNLGLWYKATSLTGVPQIRIFVDMSPDMDEDNFVIPSGVSDLETALTDINGIVVQYVGAQATATVEVIENALVLCAPAGTELFRYDLTVAANDTIAEIVALVDALADWTCTKHADMAGSEGSRFLKLLVATACKTSAVTLAIELPRFKSISVPPMRYMRIRAQGVSSNPVDTVVTAKLFVQ